MVVLTAWDLILIRHATTMQIPPMDNSVDVGETAPDIWLKNELVNGEPRRTHREGSKPYGPAATTVGSRTAAARLMVPVDVPSTDSIPGIPTHGAVPPTAAGMQSRHFKQGSNRPSGQAKETAATEPRTRAFRLLDRGKGSDARKKAEEMD